MISFITYTFFTIVCSTLRTRKLLMDRTIFKRQLYANFVLTHSVAVTTNELEIIDFPPLKLTETSRVLK